MESCPTYKPSYDKRTGGTYLKAAQGRCLHYYFYFIDEELGLFLFLGKVSHIRRPYRLQSPLSAASLNFRFASCWRTPSV